MQRARYRHLLPAWATTAQAARLCHQLRLADSRWLALATITVFAFLAALVGACDGGLALRASAAIALAWSIVSGLGARWIATLRAWRVGAIACAGVPQLADRHAAKRATPTLGGGLVVAATAAVTLLLSDIRDTHVTAALMALAGFGAWGTIDDLAKHRTGRRGLSARAKLVGQIALALVITWWINSGTPTGEEHSTLVPYLGWVNISWLWWPLAVLTIVGGSNGVNLTDGLDGLAGGCVAMSLAALAVVTLLVDPLDSAFLAGSAPTGASLLVVIGAALGAILAFLHFNLHPARVFLGDSGSLPLGALLGVVAVAARCELILLVLGAVFVAETLSVVAQVTSFRVLRRRVLRCAPLHHHFELQGWSEQRIVSRFWTAAVAVGLVAVMVTSASVRGGDRSARNEGQSTTVAEIKLFALPHTREVIQEPRTSPLGFVSIAHAVDRPAFVGQ